MDAQQMSTKRKLRAFPGLRAEDFQHPLDKQATSALEAVPGFSLFTKKFMEFFGERFWYHSNISNNLRVTGKMMPHLTELLNYACRILDVYKIPELYIMNSPLMNAYAYGETNPFIVLTSSALDQLSDQELFCVIAHELGHIKCRHVLYKTMVHNITFILELAATIKFGTMASLFSLPIQYALLEWNRCSELSADRASLICVQDKHQLIRLMMKLAAPSIKYADELDEETFLQQARTYVEFSESSFINKMYNAYQISNTTHPYLTMRAKYIDEWIFDGGFKQLTGIGTHN